MRNEENPSLDDALQRLRTSNEVRELGGLLSPVQFNRLPLFHGVLLALFNRLYPTGPVPLPHTSRKGAMLRAPLGMSIIIILRLLANRFSPRRTASGLVQALVGKLVTYQAPSGEITGYVNSSGKEEPLIRVCMLLRAMDRYGACIELLIKRFNSDQTADRTRYWLAFFLREIGDTESAELISQDSSALDAFACAGSLSQQSSNGSKLKYGVVVTTMFDSDVFRASVLSLLNSDFPGQVVVAEDGNQTERECEEFCRNLPVKYVKNPEWNGVSTVLNIGLEQLDPETDIVFYTHSDVLWPPQWFSQVDAAWNKVYHQDNVDMINLGYLDCRRNNDPAVIQMFTGQEYENLHWLLGKMKGIDGLVNQVKDCQIQDKSRVFGLSYDAFADQNKLLRSMAGRISVGCSFRMQSWKDIGGFDPEMGQGLDLELFCHALKRRRWSLWCNNMPLIHLSSVDTRRLTPADRQRWASSVKDTYDGFLEKHGWDAHHFYMTYFAETYVIYEEEITEAANNLQFSEIDYIFDEIFHRLETKRLSNCDLTWCASRSNCPYQ